MTTEYSSAHGPDAELVWRDDELCDPHASAEKAAKVRRMFAAIAHSYDLNNRVHSLWRDQAWRRCAVRRARVNEGDVVLDVACGTGDLTQAFARTAAARVIGVDFTPEMLEQARRKLHRLPSAQAARIEYRLGDAMALELDDRSVDVVSIAFGIRNVADPEQAVGEFARVLRPGGRLVILEFDRPRFAPLRWFNDFYCGWFMPRSATALSRDRSGAYRYLPKSVGAFMPREAVLEMLDAHGFEDLIATPLTFGVCMCYLGVKRTD